MIIAGQHYATVFLQDGDPIPDGMSDDDYGWCDFDSGTIYVKVTACSSRNHGTRVHEILHAAFEASGAEWFIGEMATRASMDADFVLESVIRMITPALMGVINAN